jgi:hypothetical protein
MENKRGFVQINIEEYDRLREIERRLNDFLNGDKCARVIIREGYGKSEEFIINPPPDFKAYTELIERKYQETKDTYWSIKNRYKRISIFDIGKRVDDIINK